MSDGRMVDFEPNEDEQCCAGQCDNNRPLPDEVVAYAFVVIRHLDGMPEVRFLDELGHSTLLPVREVTLADVTDLCSALAQNASMRMLAQTTAAALAPPKPKTQSDIVAEALARRGLIENA